MGLRGAGSFDIGDIVDIVDVGVLSSACAASGRAPSRLSEDASMQPAIAAHARREELEQRTRPLRSTHAPFARTILRHMLLSASHSSTTEGSAEARDPSQPCALYTRVMAR
jgi:hypothetical protein